MNNRYNVRLSEVLPEKDPSQLPINRGREIKFRVWYPNEKRMYYTTIEGAPGTLGPDAWDEPYAIQECTGVRDKNGKEIYEGDIVKVARCHTSNTETSKGVIKVNLHEDGVEQGSVLWLSERWSVSFKRYDDFDDLINCSHRYEIIGNIFENSEIK